MNSALTVPNAAKNLQRALAKITLYMDPRTIAKIKKSPTNNMVKMLFFAPTDDKIVREASDADVEELIEYWRSYKPKPWEDILSDHPTQPREYSCWTKYPSPSEPPSLHKRFSPKSFFKICPVLLRLNRAMPAIKD